MLKNILIGIIIIIAISQIMRLCFNSYLNSQKREKKEVLSSGVNSPKKALIVYQPGATANSSRIAHQIAKGINDAGFEVTLNHPGDYLPTDVSIYSIIVFGSPVYSGQPSKALTDYMSKVKISSSNRIALYSTGSFKFYMELDTMEQALVGAKAYKKIKFLTSANKDNSATAYKLGKDLTK